MGMQSSSYEWPLKSAALVASGYDYDGKLKKSGERFKNANAAYTLLTTPSEYALYLIEMMKSERTPYSISSERKREMLTESSRSEKEKRVYGLGWALSKSPQGKAASHGGSNRSGFRCYSRFYPESRNGIVIMSNAMGGKRLYQALLEKIEAEFGSGH